jgi:hypothetical protein
MDTGMCTGASSRIECGSESWAAGGFRRGAAPSRGRRGAGKTLFESITSNACRHTCTGTIS